MTEKEQAFVAMVYKEAANVARPELPWRRRPTPYRVLVSEIMLQQTQVERVIPKFKEFMVRFPSFRALASASLKEVLEVWQGLGYNRRAKMLWQLAGVVVRDYRGRLPRTHKELTHLPGIGSYTASAILVFAFNQPSPMIETNIRTVYLHHFFKDMGMIPDAQLLPVIVDTFDANSPREWGAALMDYGTHLKKTVGNVNTKSAHYKKQAPFKGSNRALRGALIRVLALQGQHTDTALTGLLKDFDRVQIKEQLSALVKEGLVVKMQRSYTLPT